MDSILYSQEHHDDPHVRKLVDLSSFNDVEMIKKFLNVANGRYARDEIVYVAIYDCLVNNIDINRIKLLLSTGFQDDGKCINGYSLLQHMIIQFKSASDIRTLIEAGLSTFATCFFFKKTTVSILIDEIMKVEKEETVELFNFFDILDYFFSINLYISSWDKQMLLLINFTCTNAIERHPNMKMRLQNLQENDPTFQRYYFILSDFGKKCFNKECKFTAQDFFNLDIKKQSMLLMDFEIRMSLSSPLFYPTGFTLFFLEKIYEAIKLKDSINWIMQTFQTELNLPEECTILILRFLKAKEIKTFNKTIT